MTLSNILSHSERMLKYAGKHFLLSPAILIFIFVNQMLVCADMLPQTSWVSVSGEFIPSVLQAIRIDPDNPLHISFFFRNGQERPDDSLLRSEALRLVGYFLAALTIPEDEVWVNLSPFEKGKIIPAHLGRTELGRDLLSQDYMLKKISASLLFPKGEFGKKFWGAVYRKARAEFGTIDIPMESANKIWISPDRATIYEHNGVAVIIDAHMKVQLDRDQGAASSGIAVDVMRAVLLPELEKEVNLGRHFSDLRKIYHSMTLAAWYRRKIHSGILSGQYVDRARTDGLNLLSGSEPQMIYAQYMQSISRGVFDVVGEEPDFGGGEVIPRRYSSGGFSAAAMDWGRALQVVVPSGQDDAAQLQAVEGYRIDVTLQPLKEHVPKVVPVAPVGATREDRRKWRISGKLDVEESVRLVSQTRETVEKILMAEDRNGQSIELLVEFRYAGLVDGDHQIKAELSRTDQYGTLFNTFFVFSPKDNRILHAKEGYANFLADGLGGLYRELFQVFFDRIGVVSRSVINNESLDALTLGRAARAGVDRPGAPSLYYLILLQRALGEYSLDRFQWHDGRNPANYKAVLFTSLGISFSDEVRQMFQQAMTAEKAWWVLDDENQLDGVLDPQTASALETVMLSVEDVLAARAVFPDASSVRKLAGDFLRMKHRVEAQGNNDVFTNRQLLLESIDAQTARLLALVEELDPAQVGGISLDSRSQALEIIGDLPISGVVSKEAPRVNFRLRGLQPWIQKIHTTNLFDFYNW